MKLFRIKDNTLIKKEDLNDINDLVGKIENKTLDELEREGIFIFPDVLKDSQDMASDSMILQRMNDNYRTRNLMGFIGSGDERLIIESRFSEKGEDFFFQYLLSQVLDFPNIVDLNTDANQDRLLFNFLIFLFPYYLKSALRKGLFKRYITRKYNDENIKGTIDIARHLKQNTPFLGKVAYNQREFSYDNSLLELIRHTIEYIRGKSYGRKLLGQVRDEVKKVIQATPNYKISDRQKIILENKKNNFHHAYYREYLSLQRLCLLILQHQKHHIGSGNQQIYGILFDGAWLWEEYINSLIGDIFYHPMNKNGQGAQRLFNRNTGLVYPDFISKDKINRIIADAKYKPIGNIRNRDYLQVLAYMFRFEAKKGYYLYPEAEERADLEFWLNRGTTYENNVRSRDDISVIKHGLKIPRDTHSYEEFVEKIRLNEEEFKRIFISENV